MNNYVEDKKGKKIKEKIEVKVGVTGRKKHL